MRVCRYQGVRVVHTQSKETYLRTKRLIDIQKRPVDILGIKELWRFCVKRKLFTNKRNLFKYKRDLFTVKRGQTINKKT